MAQAVVDEADVRAPALVADDGVELALARLSFPEPPEVAVIVAQVGELAAQFAGAHVSVVVDHDRGLAGGAGHRPRVRRLDVFELDFVVECQRPLVPSLAEGSLDAVEALEYGRRVVAVDLL